MIFVLLGGTAFAVIWAWWLICVQRAALQLLYMHSHCSQPWMVSQMDEVNFHRHVWLLFTFRAALRAYPAPLRTHFARVL